MKIRLLTDDKNVRRLEDIEKEVITYALSYYNGAVSEVARRLRIGRSSLYRKITAYDLELSSLRDTEVPLSLTEEEQLLQIKCALWDYHNALDKREHGWQAQNILVREIENILEHWKQGRTTSGNYPRPIAKD